jgi:hypothetical protein
MQLSEYSSERLYETMEVLTAVATSGKVHPLASATEFAGVIAEAIREQDGDLDEPRFLSSTPEEVERLFELADQVVAEAELVSLVETILGPEATALLLESDGSLAIEAI